MAKVPISIVFQKKISPCDSCYCGVETTNECICKDCSISVILYSNNSLELWKDNSRIFLKDAYGARHWYKDRKHHRDMYPALIEANGTKIWFSHGVLQFIRSIRGEIQHFKFGSNEYHSIYDYSNCFEYRVLSPLPKSPPPSRSVSESFNNIPYLDSLGDFDCKTAQEIDDVDNRDVNYHLWNSMETFLV